MKLEDLKSIEVTCNTENIPAPFSYHYLLHVEIDSKSDGLLLPVKYDLEYTDREDLEEEDILDEGFSLNDDFSWSGNLPQIWFEELREMFNKTSWSKNPPSNKKSSTASLIISLTDKDGRVANEFPSNQESWEYFLQEMIQAIYEISSKELPLEVKFKEINDKKQEILILIQPFFSSRTVNISIESEKKGVEVKQIPWNNLKPILKSIYFPDYNYEFALEKIPNKAGKYIDNGEGVWYEFGVGVRNPNKNVNSLEKLERSLKELVVE